MNVTFSYAGKIGGLGQGYITSKTVLAAIRMESLYQLFARDFDEAIGKKAQEATKIKTVDEFSIAHGLLARMLTRFGMTYFISNLDFDKKVAKRLKPCDIFHAFASQSLKSVIQAKKFGAKVVADNPTGHPKFLKNILTEEYRRWKVPFSAYNRIALNHRLRALDLANRVLVLSNFSYETFVDQDYPSSKIDIVPYGVDCELFKPRQKYDEKFRVLFVGQLSLRKGIQYLLEAWKLLKLKDAELVLVGGIRPDALYIFKKYEGVVDFAVRGPLTDMESIAREYNKASVAVSPSLEDGFGMVVTEAIASGIPVIVTENVGAKDVIHDGKNGYIVPVRDAEALSEKILMLYKDEDRRREMGGAARKEALKHSWQLYGDRIFAVYQGLVGK